MLLDRLDDISNPESVNYGAWLSRDEVCHILRPLETRVEAVRKFVAPHELYCDHCNYYCHSYVPLSFLEEKFSLNYRVYVSDDKKKKVWAVDKVTRLFSLFVRFVSEVSTAVSSLSLSFGFFLFGCCSLKTSLFRILTRSSLIIL